MFSFVIGNLVTAITWSFAITCRSSKDKNVSVLKRKKIAKKKQEKVPSKNMKQVKCKFESKGVNKMTMIVITFLVSIGVSGHDSGECITKSKLQGDYI